MKNSWLTGAPVHAARGRWMCGWVARSRGWLDAGPVLPGEIEMLAADEKRRRLEREFEEKRRELKVVDHEWRRLRSAELERIRARQIA